MKRFAARYVELAQSHAQKMAERWADDVQNNIKTSFYKKLDREKIIAKCIGFYHNFSLMFTDDKPSEQALEYFRTYARESYLMGIPMEQAVYALSLMRRHIWLYAEFQTIFSTAIDQEQAVDTLSRTILVFDYAAYEITKEYEALIHKEKSGRDADEKVN